MGKIAGMSVVGLSVVTSQYPVDCKYFMYMEKTEEETHLSFLYKEKKGV